MDKKYLNELSKDKIENDLKQNNINERFKTIEQDSKNKSMSINKILELLTNIDKRMNKIETNIKIIEASSTKNLNSKPETRKPVESKYLDC